MRVGKEEKCCINCAINWDREGRCEECRFEHKDHPSLFYRITRSPEILARSLCGNVRIGCFSGYYSMLTGMYYPNMEEAISATLARLKEVEK